MKASTFVGPGPVLGRQAGRVEIRGVVLALALAFPHGGIRGSETCGGMTKSGIQSGFGISNYVRLEARE